MDDDEVLEWHDEWYKTKKENSENVQMKSPVSGKPHFLVLDEAIATTNQRLEMARTQAKQMAKPHKMTAEENLKMRLNAELWDKRQRYSALSRYKDAQARTTTSTPRRKAPGHGSTTNSTTNSRRPKDIRQ